MFEANTRRPVESVVCDILHHEKDYETRSNQGRLTCVDNEETQRRELYDCKGKLTSFFPRQGLPSTDFPFHSWQFSKDWGFFSRGLSSPSKP